jgi:hypothetical protein
LNPLEFVFCAQGWSEAERDGRGSKLTALCRWSGCCCRTHCLGWGRRLAGLGGWCGGSLWSGWSVGDHGCVLGSCAVICCPGGGGLLDGSAAIGRGGVTRALIGVFGGLSGVLDRGVPGLVGGHRVWALSGGCVGCVVFAAGWWPVLRCRGMVLWGSVFRVAEVGIGWGVAR